MIAMNKLFFPPCTMREPLFISFHRRSSRLFFITGLFTQTINKNRHTSRHVCEIKINDTLVEFYDRRFNASPRGNENQRRPSIHGHVAIEKLSPIWSYTLRSSRIPPFPDVPRRATKRKRGGFQITKSRNCHLLVFPSFFLALAFIELPLVD